MKLDEQGIHIHQSDLNGHCLEQLRLDTVATGPRQETDAATVGTALHAGIEDELNNGFYDNEMDLVRLVISKFVALLEDYQERGAAYIQSSFGSPDAALKMLDSCARSWYRSDERTWLAMQTPGVDYQTEWHFDLPFMECEVQRTPRSKKVIIPVFLGGTADLLLFAKPDEGYNGELWDWKTAASSYKQWEKQRWGIQQPVYTWAAAESGLILPNGDGVYPFTFKVFLKRVAPAGIDSVTTFSGPGNWSFLAHKVFNLVNMQYQLGYDQPWPLDDGHVLCSPKWCGHWDICKGAHVSGETWT